jgi:arylsulfatase A-like enzyme
VNLVFLLFDSLNRSALSCYGGPMATPSFDRIAARGVTFDNHYAGSLPCMPARRDLLTGRLNFLHRSWGPLEPYDRCFTRALADAGIHTHLISDHYHYWEEGGCGYHNQYTSAEFVRGQERDLWKAMVQPPLERFRQRYHPMLSGVPRRFPNMVNREFIREEAEFPLVQCVQRARQFLDLNHAADGWMLQLEMFDPHEPFTAPRRFREGLDSGYDGPILDWPTYDRLELDEPEIRELQANYLAVVAMCDHHLGRLLCDFDRLDLWRNTAIVLTTDHGFLLGEHGWWGKNRMPMFDPVVHIPLLVYHPDEQRLAGARRDVLSQCLDVPCTILDLFDARTSGWEQGHSLLPALRDGTPVRDHALYGIFGGALNITDGRHTCFRYPSSQDGPPLYEYTLMPVHPQSYFTTEELRDAELTHRFDFTGGMPLLRVPALDTARRPPMQGGALADARNVLYEVATDPAQHRPVPDTETEQRLLRAMVRIMEAHEAPSELYQRFDLPAGDVIA